MTIIPPHSVKSREVLAADFDRVAKDAAEMIDIMHFLISKGVWRGVYALAHSQVTDKDPLRFFVFDPDNKAVLEEWGLSPIVINPVFETNGSLKNKNEQCITFPGRPPVPVLRYYKGHVHVDVSRDEKTMREVSGALAQVFQHEIDHFDAKYVYDSTMQSER